MVIKGMSWRDIAEDLICSENRSEGLKQRKKIYL